MPRRALVPGLQVHSSRPAYIKQSIFRKFCQRRPQRALSSLLSGPELQEGLIRLQEIVFNNSSMEEGVKLLVGTSLEGVDQEFFIYLDSKLGEGGFGVVRRAVERKSQRELAVKIIPYNGDPVKRKKIERQIDILRLLPEHPNLVRVYPYKCFSENNFYIFMELCPGNTLKEVVHQPGLLQEEFIFSYFYQLMAGYRVLWRAGIVHQDLKLANVLIKKNTLKITDFGFSILAERYKATLTREGTLHYMPYQKLTDPEYLADERSDIYSMGVMMFEIITKAHPFVNQKSIKTQKDFVTALRSANILKPKLYVTYSLELQKLFDLVIRMCAKNIKHRASCPQIYEYLDTDKVFEQFRDKEVEASVELKLRPLPVKIEEMSNPVFLPFVVEPEEEEEYMNKLKQQKEKRVTEVFQKSLEKIKNWMLGLRLVLYLFDRLGRRLVIEKIKQGLEGQLAHSYNKAILSCLTFQKRLAKQILKQIKAPTIFTGEEIMNFKKSQDGKMCIRLIEKDEEYTKESISDHLKRTIQVEIKDQKELIDLAEDKKDLKPYLEKAHFHILECIQKRLVNISERTQVVSLAYMFDALKLLRDYPQVDGEALEGYFFSTETEKTQTLVEKVMKECERAELMLPLFAMGEEDNDWI